MLPVEIIAVGRLGQPFLREGCAEYLKRLAPLCRASVFELPEQKLLDSGPAGERRVIEAEGERILAELAKRRGQAVYALCVEGKETTSEGLADELERLSLSRPGAVFVIGGSLGLSDTVKQAADRRFSLSRMTLPHQLARLVLLEQLYRAATINANIKYHK